MDSLVKRLENEVGLTSEQATKVIRCIRSYMKDNDIQPDWDEFLEAKAKKLSGSAQIFIDELLGKTKSVTDQLDEWADKAQDKLDDLSDEAQKKWDDVRHKAADFISPKKD